MSQYEDLLVDTARELDAMYERMEELIDWAENEADAPALANKLTEARGPLSSAIEAAKQYAVGVLPEPPPLEGIEVDCQDCTAVAGEQCDMDGSPYAPKTWRNGHDMHARRSDLAGMATRARSAARLEAAEHLL